MWFKLIFMLADTFLRKIKQKPSGNLVWFEMYDYLSLRQGILYLRKRLAHRL